MMHLAAGLLIGLLGSLHCLGMCGPLALALPAGHGSRARFFVGRLSYQAGRVVTYSLLGVIFGLFGQTLVLAGWQRGLSIAAGVVILASLLLRQSAWAVRASGAIAWVLGRLKGAFGPLLRRRTISALFAVGLLNGLLPCGLVYVALAGAAATGSAAGGASFMAAFGLGTVPAMLAISLAGHMLPATWRVRFQRAVPVGLTALALLFILRGLSLGIPYVSPDLSPAAVESGHSCCH